MLDHALTIRAATPDDADALRWLAALDSRPHMSGHVLLAERDGAAVAAIALSSGTVAADPFNHTADAVRFLRARRYRLLRQGGDVGAVRALVRRLAPQPLRAA
jgi:hypothetical protein